MDAVAQFIPRSSEVPKDALSDDDVLWYQLYWLLALALIFVIVGLFFRFRGFVASYYDEQIERQMKEEEVVTDGEDESPSTSTSTSSESPADEQKQMERVGGLVFVHPVASKRSKVGFAINVFVLVLVIANFFFYLVETEFKADFRDTRKEHIDLTMEYIKGEVEGANTGDAEDKDLFFLEEELDLTSPTVDVKEKEVPPVLNSILLQRFVKQHEHSQKLIGGGAKLSKIGGTPIEDLIKSSEDAIKWLYHRKLTDKKTPNGDTDRENTITFTNVEKEVVFKIEATDMQQKQCLYAIYDVVSKMEDDEKTVYTEPTPIEDKI